MNQVGRVRWVGGRVGGWVGREAERRRDRVSGWVGGWVVYLRLEELSEAVGDGGEGELVLLALRAAQVGGEEDLEVGGWLS